MSEAFEPPAEVYRPRMLAVYCRERNFCYMPPDPAVEDRTAAVREMTRLCGPGWLTQDRWVPWRWHWRLAN